MIYIKELPSVGPTFNALTVIVQYGNGKESQLIITLQEEERLKDLLNDRANQRYARNRDKL